MLCKCIADIAKTMRSCELFIKKCKTFQCYVCPARNFRELFGSLYNERVELAMPKNYDDRRCRTVSSFIVFNLRLCLPNVKYCVVECTEVLSCGNFCEGLESTSANKYACLLITSI